MFNKLPRGLGGATDLIGAGRLMDATAAIQRMLARLSQLAPIRRNFAARRCPERRR
jgi:hypothetical protein